jgi:hypothetical protein
VRSRNQALAVARRVRLAGEQGWRCCYCGCRMDPDPSRPDGVTIEHVIPKALGGTNDWINLVAACNRCNERRGLRRAPLPNAVLSWIAGEIAVRQRHRREAERRAQQRKAAAARDEAGPLLPSL